MLAGAYPSDEFAELKPRVVWDRVTDVVEGRRDARVVAVTSGGTIPDRGLFGVFMVGEAGTPGRRVGELDEEMVYESRAGEVITLGASSWRIEEISPRPGDRRRRRPACPASCRSGTATPSAGRSSSGGRSARSSARSRRTSPAATRGSAAVARRGLREHARPRRARRREPRRLSRGRARGHRRPADRPAGRRRALPRRARRLAAVLLTPFGGRVHAPWSLALEARLGERLGRRGPDDLVRRRDRDPAAGRRRRASTASRRCCSRIPTRSRTSSSGRSASSALFASRFRENAARALLLPRRRPGTRTPLWQQRQRAADLLAVASRYGSFPILVETYRECLSDVFDLPALRDVLGGVAPARDRDPQRRDAAGVARSRARSCSTTSRRTCTTATRRWPSGGPARSRSTATCCASCSARRSSASCSTRTRWRTSSSALQALTDDRQATTVDQLHDLLRRLGDLLGRRGRGAVRGRRRGRRRRG